MTEVAKGFVSKIFARSVNTQRGPRMSYNVKLEKADGSEYDNWFGFGFTRPDLTEGDYVKLTYGQNARGFIEVTEVTQLKNGPARAQKGQERAQKGQSATGGASGSFDSRGSHIHYQSSRKDAIETVKLMLEHGALPVTEAKTKAGTSKRYEEVLALIDKITVLYFFDVETLRKTKSIEDAGAAEEKEAGKLPDDEDEDGDEDADEDTGGDNDEDDDE